MLLTSVDKSSTIRMVESLPNELCYFAEVFEPKCRDLENNIILDGWQYFSIYTNDSKYLFLLCHNYLGHFIFFETILYGYIYLFPMYQIYSSLCMVTFGLHKSMMLFSLLPHLPISFKKFPYFEVILLVSLHECDAGKVSCPSQFQSIKKARH